MGDVNDNQYQINSLNSGDTFYDWINKENNEVISKLNLLKVFEGASGQGINVVVGTTLASDGGPEGDVASGTMRVSLSDSIPHGVTFQDDVTINGILNYDFGKSENSSIRIRVYGDTSSYSVWPGTDGWSSVIQDTPSSDGLTFGMPVRAGRLTKVVGSTGGSQSGWKFISDGGTGAFGIFPSQADNKSHGEVLGLVAGITTDHMEILVSGKLQADTESEATSYKGLFKETDSPYNLLGGSSAGCVYFLHSGETGSLGYEPEIVGQVSKPSLVGLGETAGVLLTYRGQYITTGTGDTGPGDTNRMTVNLNDAGHVIEVGQVVGYDPQRTFDDGRVLYNGGWFYCTDDDSSHYAVGISVKDMSNTIIEVATSGFVNDMPESDTSSPTGLLFIGSDGYLTNTNPGNIKPFAFAWDSGGERKGLIVNQLGNATPGPGSDSNNLRSLSSGSTSGGGGLGENILINGGFDIWQRDIATSSAHGITGSTYFADRWVRVDGVTSSGSTGSYSLQRMSFAGNQTSVEGNPTYYLRASHGISGSSDDYVYVENRIEDVRSVRNESLAFSFYAKSSVAGKTMGAVITQNYDGVNDQTISDIKDGGFELTAAWKKYSVAFESPEFTKTPTGKHYVALGFDMRNTGNALIDLSQVKLERGTASSTFEPIDVTEELSKCSRYYQRSYDKDATTGQSTMMGDCVPDLTVVDFIITPDRDYYYNFPTEMRDNPTVTIYSPESGTTGDGFNRSACKDVRLTSGTKGYGDKSRVSPTGTNSFTTDSKKHGIRFYVKDGAVIFDNISLHYVADADLNGNI